MAHRINIKRPKKPGVCVVGAFGAALAGAASVLPGCTQEPGVAHRVATGAPTAPVAINGEDFRLELALDQASRHQGLSGRPAIGPNSGMLFVFPVAQRLSFVMRNCTVPLDIAFLDHTGRVVAWHAMQVEPPQQADETVAAYNARLTPYESGFRAAFAVEVAGGTLQRLGVQEGDKFGLDTVGLKAMLR